MAYNSEAVQGSCLKLAAGWNNTAYLRADGRVFVQGININLVSETPLPPAGTQFIDMSINGFGGIGILSDGSALGWGQSQSLATPPMAPALPAGIYYRRVSLSVHSLFLRSDDSVVGLDNTGSVGYGNTFGEAVVPPLPVGVPVVDLIAGFQRSGILLADGSLILWGKNTHGQSTVPTLPSGVSYTHFAMKVDHTLALRSDGLIEAFGDNSLGQLNVPALPPGTHYQLVATGDGHSVALRSDGVFVRWGNPGFGLNNVPVIPAGMTCEQLVAGQLHCAARLSDGSVLSWGFNGFFDHGVPDFGRMAASSRNRIVGLATGRYHALDLLADGSIIGHGDNTAGQRDVPPLPTGVRYVSVKSSELHSVALRSDGALVAFGNNQVGQISVPPLPSGVTYVDYDLSYGHTVALRSDGVAVAFGSNSWGQCNLPTLPAGMRYTLVATSDVNLHTVLLRSDGQLFHAGYVSQSFPMSGVAGLPTQPPGIEFVELAISDGYGAALGSDGGVVVWGGVASPPFVPVPQLPFGVYYVELDDAVSTTILRTSSGEIYVCGRLQWNQDHVPALAPGTSYVQISAFATHVGARVGPTSIYVGTAPGCSGSMPSTRLVPRDTPSIGKTLAITLFDLPLDLAIMAMSFQQLPIPYDLGLLGMPGCSWQVPLDAVALLAGQATQAKFNLPIPNNPRLVGLKFYHQALVLDPGANALGLVASDAAVGVIGHW